MRSMSLISFVRSMTSSSPASLDPRSGLAISQGVVGSQELPFWVAVPRAQLSVLKEETRALVVTEESIEVEAVGSTLAVGFVLAAGWSMLVDAEGELFETDDSPTLGDTVGTCFVV